MNDGTCSNPRSVNGVPSNRSARVRQPELPVESVVAVGGGVCGDRGIGRGEVGEMLAVEDLGLEYGPEGLD